MDAMNPNQAIFIREFNWSRPKSALSFNAQPMEKPQTFPRDFIAEAIKAGAAKPVSRRKTRGKTKSA